MGGPASPPPWLVGRFMGSGQRALLVGRFPGLLFGASRLNLRIVDLAVRYHARQYGDTNISRFRHGLLLLQMSAFAARKLKFL